MTIWSDLILFCCFALAWLLVIKLHEIKHENPLQRLRFYRCYPVNARCHKVSLVDTFTHAIHSYLFPPPSLQMWVHQG